MQVSKRTSAKFYAPNNDNPPPGFVVFNKLVDERNEFYIVS